MVRMKNKKGFTLLEMMVTIGIIVIVSGALTYSVKDYVDKARAAADTASAQQDKYTVAESAVALLKKEAPSSPAATPTPTGPGRTTKTSSAI